MKNLIYLITLKPSSHRTAEESLGIQYLAAVLKEYNYKVVIRDAWLDNSISTKSINDEIIDNKNNILFVGTSSYMLNNEPTIELIKELKKSNINVASGGYGPTFEPKDFLDAGADIVMIGEGEKSIVEVAEYFEGKSKKIEDINGISYKKTDNIIFTKKVELIEDLNTIPFPVRPYLDLIKNRKSTINVLTSRGCKGSCNFCSISAYLAKNRGKRWRGRTTVNIVTELKEIEKSGIKTIKFVDDSFIENERDDIWCLDFAKQIHEQNINLNFRASIRADKVTKKNIKTLKDAGFFSFSCGIENGSPMALRRMGKLASLQDNIEALKIFKENDIYVQAGFILFDDQTTLEELEENYLFLNNNIELVSKGIFSEMYAAIGTNFTEKIDVSYDKFNANKLYIVKDSKSRLVYEYLKKWQKSHSEIYDMVIDPISAPKNIPVSEMKKYSDLMIEMKKVDLMFMKELINVVKANNDPKTLYDRYIKDFSDFFARVQAKAKCFYNNDGLFYDASINGFLEANIQKEKTSKMETFEDYIKCNKIIGKAYDFVERLSQKNNSYDFFINHFIPCAEICYNLAKMQGIDPQDAILSGMFHDIGKFCTSSIDNHEIISGRIVNKFLNSLGYSEKSIQHIIIAIKNHKLDANDLTMSPLSKILINADAISYLFHIDYFSQYLKSRGLSREDIEQELNHKKMLSKKRIDAYGEDFLSSRTNLKRDVNEKTFL